MCLISHRQEVHTLVPDWTGWRLEVCSLVGFAFISTWLTCLSAFSGNPGYGLSQYPSSWPVLNKVCFNQTIMDLVFVLEIFRFNILLWKKKKKNIYLYLLVFFACMGILPECVFVYPCIQWTQRPEEILLNWSYWQLCLPCGRCQLNLDPPEEQEVLPTAGHLSSHQAFIGPLRDA